MNNQEAKFLLRACRPDGRDAGDPAFAEPLEQAGRDPALAAWFDREQRFDATVSARLRTIQPPADLRAAILAGVHAGRTRRSWWRQPAWVALAASLVLLAALAVTLRPGRPGLDRLTAFAMTDSSDMSGHGGHGAGAHALSAQLGQPATRLLAGLDLDLEALRKAGCRSVTVGGHEIFEICFAREGLGEFHLYVSARKNFAAGPDDGAPTFVEKGRLAAATWSTARHVYSLVTDVNAAALRQIL